MPQAEIPVLAAWRLAGVAEGWAGAVGLLPAEGLGDLMHRIPFLPWTSWEQSLAFQGRDCKTLRLGAGAAVAVGHERTIGCIAPNHRQTTEGVAAGVSYRGQVHSLDANMMVVVDYKVGVETEVE